MIAGQQMEGGGKLIGADVEERAQAIEKWGEALDSGFQILPDLLLRRQRDLKITATDMTVLLHLTMHWWERDRLPFPRTSTIAHRMDVTERTVQRSIDRLKKAKLLYRKPGKDGLERRTYYDLTPLSERLKILARTDLLSERRRAIRLGEAGVQPSLPARAS